MAITTINNRTTKTEVDMQDNLANQIFRKKNPETTTKNKEW